MSAGGDVVVVYCGTERISISRLEILVIRVRKTKAPRENNSPHSVFPCALGVFAVGRRSFRVFAAGAQKAQGSVSGLL